MKKDFYDLLKIPENATTTWITRAYEQRLQAIEADTSFSEATRAAALAELGAAYRVLSSPLRKADYDAQRQKQREDADKAETRRTAMRRSLLLLGVPLLVAGGYLGFEYRQKELAMQELLREAAGREQQLAEFKRRELERQATLERERLESLRLEEERVERERRLREEEQRGKRFEADTSYKSPDQLAREKLDREAARRAQQAQDELDRNRAALELERQKRFLRESAQR